jgi:hypothetical protein
MIYLCSVCLVYYRTMISFSLHVRFCSLHERLWNEKAIKNQGTAVCKTGLPGVWCCAVALIIKLATRPYINNI